MKMLNNTGSSINPWSTPLVTGIHSADHNPLSPAVLPVSYQFVSENVMGASSESLAEVRINNIHYCLLILQATHLKGYQASQA